jgi:hypothetical protein
MHERPLILGHGRPSKEPVHEREEAHEQHPQERARAVPGDTGVAVAAAAGPIAEPVGVLDTRLSRSTCSWAPSSAHLQPRGRTTIIAMEKTLTRRRLVRRTMTKTAKD